VVLVLIASGCGTSAPAPNDGQGNPTQQTAKALQQTPDLQEVQGEQLPGKLVFVRDGTIWVWQGKQAKPLLGDGSVWQPEWSADGSELAYIERGASYSNILLADDQGNELVQLTRNDSDLPLQSHERIYDTMWAFYPTWSPGGKRITIATQYAPPVGSPAMEYTLAIYSLSTTGGSRRLLFADDSAHCGSMTYFPNSALARDARDTGDADEDESEGTVEAVDEMIYELVFTRIDLHPDRYQQIYRLDLTNEAGYAIPFPGAPPQSYDPAFSPDGKWLAFAAQVDGQTDIWVLPGSPDDEDTPRPQRLTTIGTARAPVFSPDGDKLAFLAVSPKTSSFDLWVMDVQSDKESLLVSEPRQVTEAMGLDADSGLSWAR
jgi:TolB protein